MARRAPAFQFYVDDFIGGTHYMAASSVGVYVRLLCFQFANDLLPSCHARLARIAGVSDSEFEACWHDLSSKFASDDNGHVFNERLKSIVAEQVARSEARSAAGKLGGNKQAKRKQIRNKNKAKGDGVGDGVGVGSGKGFVPPSVDEVGLYCAERKNQVDASTFVDFYTSKGWKVGDQKMKDWRAAVRTWESNGSHKTKSSPKPEELHGL